jgi:sulfur carrier protein
VSAPAVDAIALTLNGRSVELPAGATVATAVERFAGAARMVAVERNGEIVPRARWAATPLATGDRVELVRFVQGG